MTAVDQVPGRRAVELHAIGLEERAFVPIDPQPAQADKNAFDHLGRRALKVGVFNAQNQRAAESDARKAS